MKPWSPAAPRRTACPHRRLSRLLTHALPPDVALGESRLRPWASANFVGARHIFPCTVAREDTAGPLRKALQDRLRDACWSLPGHIVADIAVETDEDGALWIEILTVEVICPLLSGPKLMIFWMTKEIWNAEQEASPGRDYRQAA